MMTWAERLVRAQQNCCPACHQMDAHQQCEVTRVTLSTVFDWLRFEREKAGLSKFGPSAFQVAVIDAQMALEGFHDALTREENQR